MIRLTAYLDCTFGGSSPYKWIAPWWITGLLISFPSPPRAWYKQVSGRLVLCERDKNDSQRSRLSLLLSPNYSVARTHEKLRDCSENWVCRHFQLLQLARTEAKLFASEWSFGFERRYFVHSTVEKVDIILTMKCNFLSVAPRFRHTELFSQWFLFGRPICTLNRFSPALAH